jgi:hypothetical protein
MPDVQAAPPYDPHAIFAQDGPIDPWFIADAVQALMRAHPIDNPETENARQRHRQAALIALQSTNPRDPIEVMLGVQAVAAHQAACIGWWVGMNAAGSTERLRHMSAACSAARTFAAMLTAIERRQAKPLTVPVGRPASRPWPENEAETALHGLTDRIIRIDENDPAAELSGPPVVWTPEALAIADTMIENDRIESENEGLDIANTPGILPGGGMILMDDPTPQQAAYMGRRLRLMYKREYQENLRNGIDKIPKLRPIRPGDLIP